MITDNCNLLLIAFPFNFDFTPPGMISFICHFLLLFESQVLGDRTWIELLFNYSSEVTTCFSRHTASGAMKPLQAILIYELLKSDNLKHPRLASSPTLVISERWILTFNPGFKPTSP